MNSSYFGLLLISVYIMCAPLTIWLWCGMPGVQTTRRELVSDHARCDRLAYWPSLSGLLRNDHLIVRMWQKREHTHCMLLIRMAEGLIPWELLVGCFRLGL